jgi:hypothetical protein
MNAASLSPGSPAQSARQVLLWILVFILGLGLLSFGIHSLTQKNNLGSDYYIYYVAGRTLFIDHQNPYSDAVATLVQLSVFKRLAKPGEDQVGFAYPPYAFLPAVATFWLPFDWGQAIWMALNLLALMSAIYLAFPKAKKWAAVSFLFFFPVSFALILGNFNILVTAIIILAYGIITTNQALPRPTQVILGVLLAWATVKPQFAWLFIAFLLIAAFRKRFWPVLISFCAGMLALLAFSFMVLPGWPMAWFERLTKYQVYLQTWLILTFFLKSFLSLNTAEVITWITAAACWGGSAWFYLEWWQGKLSDLVMMAWAGLLIFLFHPRGVSYEHITFLIPLLIWVCSTNPLPRLAVAIFWFGSLAASWVIFVVSRFPAAPDTVSEWTFFFYVGWFVWLMLPYITQINRSHQKIAPQTVTSQKDDPYFRG